MTLDQAEVDAWNSAQSGVTAMILAFYPFITCLLYQIRHEMASNPKAFTWRKIQLVTLLTTQIVIFTFLRDQYVWNEDINEEKELPNSLLCGLSRFLYYGLIEICIYFLIISIIWDETEAQNISTHQLNQTIVTNIKKKYETRSFHFTMIWKMYTFFMACLTLLPSSILPKPVQNQFLDGIDKYRCEYSNVTIIVGITNKIIFLILCLYSSIKLKRTSLRHYLSNTISLFIMVPICIMVHIFTICNENWLNILSFDTSRKISFICVIIFNFSVSCNHIMMQAQAKRKIVAGVKRGSLMIKKAANAARESMRRGSVALLGKDFMKINKIEIDTNENRFSIPEITEDEYDAIMVHSESRTNANETEEDDDIEEEEQNEGDENKEDDSSEKDQDLDSEELLIRQIQDLKNEIHAESVRDEKENADNTNNSNDEQIETLNDEDDENVMEKENEDNSNDNNKNLDEKSSNVNDDEISNVNETPNE